MVAVCDGLETCVHVSAGKHRHGSGSGAKPAEAGKKGSGSGSGSGAKPAAIKPAATKPAFSKPAAAGSGKSGKRGEETSDIELSSGSGAYSGPIQPVDANVHPTTQLLGSRVHGAARL